MAASHIALVTGANTGIGYEIVKALLQSSKQRYHVILGGRSVEKGQAAVEKLRQECTGMKNAVEFLQLDVEKDESIQKAFDIVKEKHGRVDSLINNAGASFDPAFLKNKLTLRECFNKAYDVNVSGANVTTWVFMPLLLKSSDPRLIFIAGLSALFEAARGNYFPTPEQPAGWPKSIVFETIGYRCSKVALNMLMLDWQFKLKNDGVKVWAVGPGMLLTDLGRDPELKPLVKQMGAGDPSLGGDIVRRVVEGERDADQGKLVVKDGKTIDF